MYEYFVAVMQAALIFMALTGAVLYFTHKELLRDAFWIWKHNRDFRKGVRDNCQICKGECGGVKGNENIVNGVVMCDYCTSNHFTQESSQP